MAKVKKKSKKVTKKKVSKKSVLTVLQGSTKFRTEVSLLMLRFDPEFLVKFLKDIAEDVDKGKVIQISQGTSVIIVLCEETLAKSLEKKYKRYVIDHKKDLVALILMSPKKIVDTPGVLSFILDRFSKNGINVIEIIGAYTDTTFVINRKDLFKAMDLLGEFVL